MARDYVQERRRGGHLTPATARSIRCALLAFCRHVGPDRLPDSITEGDVVEWLGSPRFGPGTVAAHLSKLHRFFLWLRRRGHASTDPTLDVTAPRQPRRLPRGLTRAAVTSTLAACPDARARLMVLLQAQEGLRCHEVSGLELDNIDRGERLLLIRGKGGHERVLPLSEETHAALLAYLPHRVSGAGRLIRSYNRPRAGIGPRYVSTLVSSWIRAGGTDATAHALRHTMATDVLRAGAHLRDVQAALGHASLATTQRYLPWVVGSLKEAMGGRTYGEAR